MFPPPPPYFALEFPPRLPFPSSQRTSTTSLLFGILFLRRPPLSAPSSSRSAPPALPLPLLSLLCPSSTLCPPSPRSLPLSSPAPSPHPSPLLIPLPLALHSPCPAQLVTPPPLPPRSCASPPPSPFPALSLSLSSGGTEKAHPRALRKPCTTDLLSRPVRGQHLSRSVLGIESRGREQQPMPELKGLEARRPFAHRWARGDAVEVVEEDSAPSAIPVDFPQALGTSMISCHLHEKAVAPVINGLPEEERGEREGGGEEI